MDHEWSRSCNFLNKLIREFLLSNFRLEALFGHPVFEIRQPLRQAPIGFILEPEDFEIANLS